MDKNVQLKEEEIVGQESVLSDIYPRTDTSSIEDNRTGENLDITLADIYEMINNKLTRVVNSVNGRSGSIVLSQEDVGLSNVDNISFDDIKSWTNDAISNAFDNKNLVLSSSSETLARLLTYGDPAYNNASFFVTNWSTADLRPALGKIRVPDPSDSSNPYKVYSRMLNTVEETNKALTYENGKLNLKLAPDQHGLAIGSDGLRLDTDVLKRGIRVFENFYYINNEETSESTDGSIVSRDTGFLLDYQTGQDPMLEAPKATIRIGARQILSESGADPIHYIDPDIANSITEDVLIIITGIVHDRYIVNSNLNYNQSLVSTGPLIGYVKIEDDVYNFYFVPFTVSPGFGLINTTGNPWNEQTSPDGYYHNALSVNTIIDERNISSEDKNERRVSYSGLQAIASASAPFNSMSDVKPTIVMPNSSKTDAGFSSMNFIMTPEGRTNLFETYQNDQDYMFKGGLFVPTDASLCAMPYEVYGYRTTDESGSERSEAFENWFAPTPYYANSELVSNHIGFMNSPTFIGINLLKGYTENGNADGKTAYSLSGLRVVDPGQMTLSKHNGKTLNWEMFGMNEEVDANRFITARYSHDGEKLVNEGALDSPLTPADLSHTGGLMVNVGKGLEIMPFGIADNGVTFDRMGKVNVRLGAGLEFDKYNRITVTGGGGGSSGTGLLNASQLSIQSLNIAGSDSQATEANKARIDYEATTFHDPYLYGDNNLFTQSIIELGDGLAIEVTRNDFLDTMFKRATITQILASNVFANLLDSTWESIYNSIMTGSSIFTDDNPSNVTTLNTFITTAKSHPYDTATVEQCQSPSTLLMDWIRFNPDQGYDVGKAMTISSLIAAYKQNHPDYA